jgi:hypothetical protein
MNSLLDEAVRAQSFASNQSIVFIQAALMHSADASGTRENIVRNVL